MTYQFHQAAACQQQGADVLDDIFHWIWAFTAVALCQVHHFAGAATMMEN